jgi:CMP-2-keto-3-deoxyoctulosonic acid synthetase
VVVASVMQKLGMDEDINNPNFVKVVCDKNNNALYFSRSPIPYKRNLQSSLPIYKHVGVYAFKKNTLLEFTKWPMGVLEQTEMLEQLRYLENGVSIKMVETTTSSIGIDTPEDLEKAKLYYANRKK